MSTLYITEFISTLIPMQAPVLPALAEQTLAIGGASTQSAQLQAGTSLIRIHTDSICSVKVGLSPVATTSSARMTSGQTEYFCIPPQDQGQFQVAVIGNS